MLPYKSRSLATPEGEIFAVLYFVMLMSPVNVIPVGMISLLKGSGRGGGIYTHRRQRRRYHHPQAKGLSNL